MEELNNNLTDSLKEFSSDTECQSESFENSQKAIAQDAVKIHNLVQSGILNQQQGQYCMSQLAKKSLERLTQDLNNTVSYQDAFAEFNRVKPDFFKSDGRLQVLNYLKNSNVSVDKDEIDTISQLVENLEKCAIDRYVKQQAHEKVLNDENEFAKRKLTANAQDNSFANNKNMTFTREQIGKMSGAEFTKYEPLILEQATKGLIR